MTHTFGFSFSVALTKSPLVIVCKNPNVGLINETAIFFRTGNVLALCFDFFYSFFSHLFQKFFIFQFFIGRGSISSGCGFCFFALGNLDSDGKFLEPRISESFLQPIHTAFFAFPCVRQNQRELLLAQYFLLVLIQAVVSGICSNQK
jgi:hypothetical protein